MLQIVASLAAAEDRACKAEKEMAMMTRELEVVRDNYDEKIQALEAERDQLQQKLHHMVLVAEKVSVFVARLVGGSPFNPEVTGSIPDKLPCV